MLEFSLVPIGGGESLHAFVAEMLDIVDRSGVTYRLHPMGTILEGEYDEVMAVVGACLARAQALADRVSLSLKLDWRRGSESRLEAKVEAVERQLGRRLRTGE